MQDILQWSRSIEMNQKPWLLLGKGPSFGKISQVNLNNFLVCTLNHVIREVPATLAHIIDLDVVQDCADLIDKNAKYLVLPYRPHVNCSPSRKTIHDFVSELPLLGKLAGEGRLLWYNLSSSKQHGDSPVIEAKFFSAEAALNILAACGARMIRSLGIDGGSSYSAKFNDLSGKTLLANGHDSFDKQFQGIAKTILTTGVFYAPLHVQAPVRVFVGADSAQLAGIKVLEYSIKKFASMSVEVCSIDDGNIPVPRSPANRSRTGFSFSRFHIPKLCDYRGRAIYMDADMQVFTDVANLWSYPFDGAAVLYSEENSDGGRKPQFSVMLMDCEKLTWDVAQIVKDLDEGRYDYKGLMHQLCILPENEKRAALPFEWNSLERYDPGKTRLIHYTDMPTQPWVSKANKNGSLWYRCLREAVEEGFITTDFLYQEIEEGHVSPELPRWLGLADPPDFSRLKKDWVPPYRRFASLPNVNSC